MGRRWGSWVAGLCLSSGSALAAGGELGGLFSFGGAAGGLRLSEWLVSFGCPTLETLYMNKFALCLIL